MIGTVFGVGINDAGYQVSRYEDGKRVWACPFYVKWKDMLKRCYRDSYKETNPTYTECSVCNDWIYFTKFKSWMEQQDWEGKQLDKDLLVTGNKVYSPETCVFIDNKVNTFLIERNASRGAWPIGVSASGKRFSAYCRVLGKKGNEYLGKFDTPEEAHQAWLAFKLGQACILADEQTDDRIAKALISRYENYDRAA